MHTDLKTRAEKIKPDRAKNTPFLGHFNVLCSFSATALASRLWADLLLDYLINLHKRVRNRHFSAFLTHFLYQPMISIIGAGDPRLNVVLPQFTSPSSNPNFRKSRDFSRQRIENNQGFCG